MAPVGFESVVVAFVGFGKRQDYERENKGRRMGETGIVNFAKNLRHTKKRNLEENDFFSSCFFGGETGEKLGIWVTFVLWTQRFFYLKNKAKHPVGISWDLFEWLVKEPLETPWESVFANGTLGSPFDDV